MDENTLRKRLMEQKLFEEITRKHTFGNSTSIQTNEETFEMAKRQYLETHDRLPTLEEIDAVIEDYRKSLKERK